MTGRSLASDPLTGTPRGHHDPGDGGHAHAADADEVHAAQRVLAECAVAGHLDTASSTRSAMSRSASLMPRFSAFAAMASSRDRSVSSGNEPGADPFRGEVPVRHQERAAGLHQPVRVQRLLAVADGQRHEDCGNTDGGHLAHGGRAGTGEQQVRGGVDRLHAVDVFELPVAVGLQGVAVPRPRRTCRGR